MKIEPNGVGGAYLRDHVRVGDALEVSSPRGTFILQSGEGPVVLLSAGIGATPVLAMLHAMSSARSTRPVLWLHAARDGKHLPFAAEVRRLVSGLAHGRSYVCFSRPEAADRLGTDFDAAGHLSRAAFDKARPDAGRRRLPMRADPLHGGHEGGPGGAWRQAGSHSHRDLQRRRVVDAGRRRCGSKAPHRPAADLETGPLVSFARSGVAAHWNSSAYQSLLELAEACDVPVRWACRTGVCHNCESGLVSGEVAYEPQPLDLPATGNLLICCSRPVGDVVVDL